MKMPLSDAVITAILGYGVVFFGLVLLMGVVLLQGKAMTARKAAQPAPAREPEQPAPAAPGSAGQVKLFDVPDREAAMLMAIVADQMGKPLNQLRFKSIKEVKQDEV